MIAARLLRRLMRKITKPFALWWTLRQLDKTNQRADHFLNLRSEIVPMELRERRRAVQLTARRNHIQSW